MTLILQNTISRFNFFRIESFDSWVCEPRKKKICWLSQQGTEKSIFRVIFRIGFGIMTAMILQNTISRFNVFRIESLDTWVCSIGEPRKKKNCWMSKKGTEKSIFRVIFRICFGIRLQWFCKIPFPDSTSFKMKVLWAECVMLESHEKKNLLNVTERNREVNN